MIKYLRRTPSAAAGNDLGSTIKEHSPATQSERNDQVPTMHNERRRGQQPGHHNK
jgi:hypothetical protein